MRPRHFTDEVSARRWSLCGGVALYVPPELSRPCAIFGNPLISSQKSDTPSGWALWWAGKAGVVFARVSDRGQPEQRIELEREEAEWLIGQSLTGPTFDPSSLPTVLDHNTE